jgi:hypothetical protein
MLQPPPPPRSQVFPILHMMMMMLMLLLLLEGTSAFLPPLPTQTTTTSRSRREGGIMMGVKNVKFGDKGLDKLVEGINVVGNAVKVRMCYMERSIFPFFHFSIAISFLP